MRFRRTLVLFAALSSVVLFGSATSARADRPSQNHLGGGGIVATCQPVLPGCSPGFGSLIVGLGVTGNTDGTNVRGAVTIASPLTTEGVGSVTIKADCLIVGPAFSGGLLATTGGPVVTSTGLFANFLHRGDHVYVKAFDAAPGSFPAQDAVNSTPGCAFPDGGIPPLAQPIESGNIVITQGT